ncbi:thioredoxin [Shewanella phage Thanatos-2]|nr:thioredoxin [Shewanella phage Thanatos-2]
MPNVIVYGFEESVFRCPPCINAKRFLAAKKIPYEFISVATHKGSDGAPVLNEVVIDELESILGTRKMTMPQIVINGHPIGGFTELQKHKF